MPPLIHTFHYIKLLVAVFPAGADKTELPTIALIVLHRGAIQTAAQYGPILDAY